MTLQTNTNRRTQTRIANNKSKTKNTTTSKITITNKNRKHAKSQKYKHTKTKTENRKTLNRKIVQQIMQYILRKQTSQNRKNKQHTSPNEFQCRTNKNTTNKNITQTQTTPIRDVLSAERRLTHASSVPTDHQPNTPTHSTIYYKKNTRTT